MAKELINLSVTNAIFSLIHPVIAPSGFDLKPSLDAKQSISVQVTDTGTRRRALDGNVGAGQIYVDYTTEFQLLPDSDAVRLFFNALSQYEKINGKTLIPFLYVTYGAQRIQHIFSGGVLMNYSPMASFQDDAQNQSAQIVWADYNAVGL
jgi:hypothetical protein